MKHLLIILSFLLLSSPVIGNSHKGETLYMWGKYPDYKWMGFGDKDTNPKYQGQVKNGVPNGLGYLIYPDGVWRGGNKYVGSWKNGEMWNGTYTYRNGSKYVGSWKDWNYWKGTSYDKDGKILWKYEIGIGTK